MPDHRRPELLDNYQSDRLQVIRTVVRATETATKAFNSTNPVVHALLTRIAPIALSRDRVQAKATAMVGRGRVLLPRHGDRARQLHDLLDLGGLTLLVTDPAAGLTAFDAWQDVLTVRR